MPSPPPTVKAMSGISKSSGRIVLSFASLWLSGKTRVQALLLSSTDFFRAGHTLQEAGIGAPKARVTNLQIDQD